MLHFAGGNCYSFVFLRKYLESHFELCPLELPGRGKRMTEPLLKSKPDAINDLFQQIKSLRKATTSYVVYGHSMGASLGLYIAERLEKTGDLALALVVTGNAGPGISKQKNRYLLPEEEFKTALKQLGGMPYEVVENEELYQFFEPILRADFEIVEKDNDLKAPVLNTSILALMGSNEENAGHIDNWKNYTHSSFKGRLLEGDHFFIHQHSEELANYILKAYDRSLVL